MSLSHEFDPVFHENWSVSHEFHTVFIEERIFLMSFELFLTGKDFFS